MTSLYYRFDYILMNPEGETVDTSEGGEALWFVEGDGRMIPGLEQAVRGHDTGDEFEVTIPPEEAYGLPQRSLIRTISADMISANVDEIEPGMIFQVGSGPLTEVVRVVDVEDGGITVDGNHPLAGVTFRFVIKVLEVRPATPDDVEATPPQSPE